MIGAAGHTTGGVAPGLTPVGGPGPARTVDFGRVLASMKDRQASASPQEAARRSAEEFVASSLIVPVLKALREQNSAAAPFAPGDSERLFGPLLDEEIAVRIARAKRFPLVDRLAQDLLRDHSAAGSKAGPMEPAVEERSEASR